MIFFFLAAFVFSVIKNCVSVVCLCMCSFSSTCMCALPVTLYADMNMCCTVTGWEPLTFQMCVGRLCSGSSACGVVADGKQLSFASVCVCVCERVCVWCGQRLKRASVHMGTNDRIWFSEPICKKMKETKLVKIRAETLPDLPQSFHCSVRWSVDGHQFLLCISSAVMSHRSNLNATTASEYVT